MTNDALEGRTDVRIELPLPLDITATLIAIIGLTWPNAVIRDSKGSRQFDNRLVLSIPESDRHKSAKKAAKYRKRKEFLNADTETTINELGPNAVSTGLPEHLASIMLAMAKSWMAAYPDAKNYLETKVFDRETNDAWVLTIARSEGKTPHALRMAAQKRVAELEAELAGLRNDEKGEA